MRLISHASLIDERIERRFPAAIPAPKPLRGASNAAISFHQSHQFPKPPVFIHVFPSIRVLFAPLNCRFRSHLTPLSERATDTEAPITLNSNQDEEYKASTDDVAPVAQ
jgi:hypothetical protein